MSNRNRRTHIILALVGFVFIYALFFSSTDNSFRTRTEAAMAHRHSIMTGDISDADLKAQTDEALSNLLKAKAAGYQGSGTQKQGVVVLEGTRRPATSANADSDADTIQEISVAGRKTMPKTSPQQSPGVGTKDKPKYPLKDSDSSSQHQLTTEPADGTGTEEAFNGAKLASAADPGEEAAREELQSILKKSPVIIFSKSYCPYSKRAKHVLLEKYEIIPSPYVVELDRLDMPAVANGKDGDDETGVTLGKKLQDLLYTLTGRKTVPNVLINARSLGGGDEVAQLDVQGQLAEKVRKMGGKRIVSVGVREEKKGD